MFSTADGVEGTKQLDLYLEAQTAYQGQIWHALGNHECTGATNSNCGPYGKDGNTKLYQAFLDKMVKPRGLDNPWFAVHYKAKDGSWTAKFVFVAANAWDAVQAKWLDATLATADGLAAYTIVVRHHPPGDSSVATITTGRVMIDKVSDAHTSAGCP